MNDMQIEFNRFATQDVYAVQVRDDVFALPYKGPLVQQVIVAHRAGLRAGTKANKSRADARGGGRKPWRQKGTGRARAGTLRSPLWRGGGVTFAARPRNYAQKVNRKMYRGAMCSILSELLRQGYLVGVDVLQPADARTRSAKAMLDRLGVRDVLILVDQLTLELRRGTSNLPDVNLRQADAVDPYLLLAHDKTLITEQALRVLEKRFS